MHDVQDKARTVTTSSQNNDAIFIILVMPCFAFILVMALLGIIKPVVETTAGWLRPTTIEQHYTLPNVPPKPTVTVETNE